MKIVMSNYNELELSQQYNNEDKKYNKHRLGKGHIIIRCENFH